jgi:hypothetical protein
MSRERRSERPSASDVGFACMTMEPRLEIARDGTLEIARDGTLNEQALATRPANKINRTMVFCCEEL